MSLKNKYKDVEFLTISASILLALGIDPEGCEVGVFKNNEQESRYNWFKDMLLAEIKYGNIDTYNVKKSALNSDGEGKNLIFTYAKVGEVISLDALINVNDVKRNFVQNKIVDEFFNPKKDVLLDILKSAFHLAMNQKSETAQSNKVSIEFMDEDFNGSIEAVYERNFYESDFVSPKMRAATKLVKMFIKDPALVKGKFPKLVIKNLLQANPKRFFLPYNKYEVPTKTINDICNVVNWKDRGGWSTPEFESRC